MEGPEPHFAEVVACHVHPARLVGRAQPCLSAARDDVVPGAFDQHLPVQREVAELGAEPERRGRHLVGLLVSSGGAQGAGVIAHRLHPRGLVLEVRQGRDRFLGEQHGRLRIGGDHDLARPAKRERVLRLGEVGSERKCLVHQRRGLGGPTLSDHRWTASSSSSHA